MSHNNLLQMTSLHAQIDSLRTTGEQFDDAERKAAWLPLVDVTLRGDNACEPALYYSHTVPYIPNMVVPSLRMLNALEEVRPARSTVQHPDALLSSIENSRGVILGFSGYGTGGGFSYETEFQAINDIFDRCHDSGIHIDMVVDGGTGFGVPGLGGAIANQRGFDTLGYLPARGLRGAAPRQTSVVTGEEFGDEALALGGTPDVLIALGGGPIAEQEIDSAIRSGSTVVLAALKQYPESSAVYLPTRNAPARIAQKAGKLVTCSTTSEISDVLDWLDMSALRHLRISRVENLHRLLAEQD